ncbi:MAG: DUF4125 family protein [Oscillospiraceae bacterium]|nr:DUF4125 family protein [Oscillospiraceae bacterium]
MYEQIDKLLSQSRLDEAYELMKKELALAEGRDVNAVMYLLGELAGFCRDTGRFDESIGYALRARREFPGDRDSDDYTAVLLNLANAYRAAGSSQAAEVYEEIEVLTRTHTIHRAAYHNNYALYLQDEGKFPEAAAELLSALALVKDDPRRTAITKANLAVCLVRTGDMAGAEKNAGESVRYFEGLTPSDFHYSAALSAMGDICAARSLNDRAARYYEAALSEIELHMGRCGFYDLTADKLRQMYGGERPHLSGAELSRRYYETFFRPVFKANFAGLADRITIGLVGEGSECLGFDDELSADHDFGPSFCVFADDSVSDEDFDRLKEAYDMLPRTYCGLTHTEGKNSSGRRGVMRTSNFYRRVLGSAADVFIRFAEHDDRRAAFSPAAEDFQLIPDEDLACAAGGTIFAGGGSFVRIRRMLRMRPDADRYAKLSAEIESMSKHGEYNLLRMVQRSDTVSAMLCASRFMESAMRAVCLIHGKFAPYHKWLWRAVRDTDTEFADVIAECTAMCARGEYEQAVGRVNAAVMSRLTEAGLAHGHEPLAAAADELLAFARRVNTAEKIIALEWDMFDRVQNVGGRADCQDDRETFSIMRKSQYYCFDGDLLDSIYSDFAAAYRDGRNVITEKYGYMMKYTVPEEYAKIEGQLPPVGDMKSQIIDAIVPIQVGWMEDFAQRYPHLAANARFIHSYDDTASSTSYETYLRGELSTYSDDTVALYGALVARTAQSGGNLAEMIMDRSVHMYGYRSLEEAEDVKKGRGDV